MTQTAQTSGSSADGTRPDGRSSDLADSPMMAHLMEALRKGQDIGHYGRLTFVMVAQYFLDDDEMVKLLIKEPDFGKDAARALVVEVKGHGYNPPRRNQILQWQAEQDFPICPNPDDPNSCNVYQELQFPDQVYENIERFWEQKAEAQER